MKGQKLAEFNPRQTGIKLSHLLSFHLSLIKSYVFRSIFGRGKVCFFVQKDSVNHKLADDDGALTLDNKASYMIKLILLSQS
jgi:hypothetical protein